MKRLGLASLFAAVFAAAAFIACDDLGLAITPSPDASAATDGAAATDAPANADSAAKPDSAITDGGTDSAVDFGTCTGKTGTSTCNPVTGAGCGGGQSCDFNPTNGDFFCRGDASFSFTGSVCAACDPATKQYCLPGSTCAPNKQCVRYCCADADCKGHGPCTLPGPFDLPGIGICFDEIDQICNVDSGTDSGTDAPADAPADG